MGVGARVAFHDAREIGERVVPGQAPAQFFEMNLKRIGDSAWPTAGAVPPK